MCVKLAPNLHTTQVVLFLTVFVGVTLLGCAHNVENQNAQGVPEFNYPSMGSMVTLEPGDVFSVRVYREKDLSGTYRVGSDGSIRFPLIGELQVSGKTPEMVADSLTQSLQDGFLRDPQVTVFVKEFRSKKVFVLGQVAKPGTFNFEQGMNLIQVITLAGGFTDLAARNRTLITRLSDGKERRVLVEAGDISQGKQPNIPLTPGDIIFVPESIL